jgi:hypothetical protein
MQALDSVDATILIETHQMVLAKRAQAFILNGRIHEALRDLNYLRAFAAIYKPRLIQGFHGQMILSQNGIAFYDGKVQRSASRLS